MKNNYKGKCSNACYCTVTVTRMIISKRACEYLNYENLLYLVNFPNLMVFLCEFSPLYLNLCTPSYSLKKFENLL